MTTKEFTEKYPSIANRLTNYRQAFRIYQRYQTSDPNGANRWMRTAENDWSMAVQMAERADVDLLGAAALFGIDVDDPISRLGRQARKSMGKSMIE